MGTLKETCKGTLLLANVPSNAPADLGGVPANVPANLGGVPANWVFAVP